MAVTAQHPNLSLSVLETARAAITLESQGVASLVTLLDEVFLQVVDLIRSTQGRLIVSGIGKSGHIGRKMAATFASTGQPALFVHPAEASHGDLGMITDQDCVFLLSNSGETSEISNIIEFCKRKKIPILSITGDKNSTLARLSEIALILPKIPEACPIGLAPTTSTTMMMALGDALAVTLLDLNGFKSAHFGDLHPGGTLGHRLQRVQHRMHTGDKIPLVKEDDPMMHVLIYMSEKGFGCTGVISNTGSLLGMITDGDLRRHMNTDVLSKTAQDIMTPDPKTIPPEMLMSEALAILNEKRITSFFVVEDEDALKIPQGFIHIHDFLRLGIA